MSQDGTAAACVPDDRAFMMMGTAPGAAIFTPNQDVLLEHHFLSDHAWVDLQRAT